MVGVVVGGRLAHGVGGIDRSGVCNVFCSWEGQLLINGVDIVTGTRISSDDDSKFDGDNLSWVPKDHIVHGIAGVVVSGRLSHDISGRVGSEVGGDFGGSFGRITGSGGEKIIVVMMVSLDNRGNIAGGGGNFFDGFRAHSIVGVVVDGRVAHDVSSKEGCRGRTVFCDSESQVLCDCDVGE